MISIDGIPVTQMTRLDCVQRLKESQFVIKLLIRCRGALRPEVISAEKKVSVELPSSPPLAPPRKLRQRHVSADGRSYPSLVKKPNQSLTTTYKSCKSSPKSNNSSNDETLEGMPLEKQVNI